MLGVASLWGPVGLSIVPDIGGEKDEGWSWMPDMKHSKSERFHELYVEHYAAVLGYCLRRMGHDEASSAADETFTVAWRRILDVPDGEGALPWLYGVAAKTLANQRRSQRRRHSLASKLRGLGHPTEMPTDGAPIKLAAKPLLCPR